MKKIKILLALFLCFVGFDVQAQSNRPVVITPTPEAWLQDKGQDLLNALSIKKVDERYGALKEVANEVFHKKEITKLSMGANWKDFTEQQKEQFRNYFYDYFVVSYANIPLDLTDVTFEIKQKRVVGKDYMLLTKIKLPSELSDALTSEKTEIDDLSIEAFFALREYNNRYYIRDAKIEGQSILMFLRKLLDTKYKNSNRSPEMFLYNMYNDIQKKHQAAKDLETMKNNQ